METTPEISDHDAIVYSLNLPNKPLSDEVDHPIYLYHKANMEGLKSDLSDFQVRFLTSDPYSNGVESMWNKFKEAVSNAITSHIPQKNIQYLATNCPGLLHQ